jgi:hypothetical protein
MDNLLLSSIQPVSAIIGAIITAIVAIVIAVFIVPKRKRVTFWVGPSEDLTLGLRQAHQQISFRVGGRDLLNLNRAALAVKNTGNDAIVEFTFDIGIPGNHPFYVAEAVIDDDIALKHAIRIALDEPARSTNPRIHISLPFFNPGESFEMIAFFDGTTDDCNIHCRMEGVHCKIKSLGFLRDWSIDVGESLLLNVSPTMGAALLAMWNKVSARNISRQPKK